MRKPIDDFRDWITEEWDGDPEGFFGWNKEDLLLDFYAWLKSKGRLKDD